MHQTTIPLVPCTRAEMREMKFCVTEVAYVAVVHGNVIENLTIFSRRASFSIFPGIWSIAHDIL
jgi:hypothetical protein